MKTIFILSFFTTVMLVACSFSKKQETGTLNNNMIERKTVDNAVLCDTIMLSFCDIDGDGLLDTISTHVYLITDTINIQYLWLKNGNTIWSESTRDFTKLEPKWIKYSVENSVPEIYKKEYFSEDILDFGIDFGIDYLSTKNFVVDKDFYKQYLLNYKGNLIVWGHPEDRRGVFIWYQPLEMFVLFYKP
jgi:hypothetical protein